MAATATTTKTTTPRRRTAATKTTKAAPTEKVASTEEATTAEKLVIALEYVRDTSNYAVFTFPADLECKGNVYVPHGTVEVKVQLIAE